MPVTAGAARPSGVDPWRLLLTGGGTGGHIFPALAIAEEVARRLGPVDVLFVGARGGMEERLVPRHGLRFVGLPVHGLVRKRPVEALRSLATLGRAGWQALRLVRRFDPQVVVGTGGYAAGPVGFAAVLLRVPLLLQEQNAVPGVTNRLLAPHAATVVVPYAAAAARLPRGTRILVAGNPVRAGIRGVERGAARHRLQLPADGPVVLCLAGSRGSAVFVRLLSEWLPHLQAGTLLFISGEAHRDAAEAAIARQPLPPGARVRCLPFVEAMGDALAAADLVVCRAGAVTLAELAAAGRPAVLIPSPHVTHHHQEANAAVWAGAGAALVLAEASLDGRRLAETVQGLLAHPERLRAMAAAAEGLADHEALPRIVARIGALAQRGRGAR
jgi:UDP-N-acetylglucosamine--N-acetylmuramyl-(pentapeptide) pyrophosphoryl-undecaprenol N-acetylglucosamine transferase